MKDGTLAYVIDPMGLTLQRVRLYGDYHAIYVAGQYECFDIVRMNDQGDGIYVDDEGLLKPNAPNNFFALKGYPDPLCGRGVVLGSDAEGESVEPSIPWEKFTDLIRPVMVMRINGEIAYLPGGKFTVLNDILDIHAKD